jgi:hypothetical protein
VIGVLGLFDRREPLIAAAHDARRRRLIDLVAFLPAYDAYVLAAVGRQRTPVPAWTLAGGIAGAAIGLLFVVWTVRQWPVLIVGGKPLVALPPFLVIAFEMSILGAALCAIAAFLVASRHASRRVAAAYDISTSDARFGLLIRCGPDAADEARDVLVASGALEWRSV